MADKNENVIPAGLRADIMRKRMEDKNTLQNKGSLYIGTGEKETDKDTNEIMYKTEELQKGNSGEVLLSEIDSETNLRKLEWTRNINITVNSAKSALKTTSSSFSLPTTKLVATTDNTEQMAYIPFSDISTENFLFYCQVNNYGVNNVRFQKQQYFCFGINAKIDNDFKIIYTPPIEAAGKSTEIIIHQTVKDQLLIVDCSNLFKVENTEKTRITVNFYVHLIK